jgi:hypothetical protein
MLLVRTTQQTHSGGLGKHISSISKKEVSQNPHDQSDLMNNIFKMTLQNEISSPYSRNGDAFWERNSHTEFDPLPSLPLHSLGGETNTPHIRHSPLSHAAPPFDTQAALTSRSLPSSPLNTPQSSALLGSYPASHKEHLQGFQSLYLLDVEIGLHFDAIVQHLDRLASPLEQAEVDVLRVLRQEKTWLTESLQFLRGFDHTDDDANKVLKDAMVDRISELLKNIEDIDEIFKARTPTEISLDVVFDTGKNISSSWATMC